MQVCFDMCVCKGHHKLLGSMYTFENVDSQNIKVHTSVCIIIKIIFSFRCAENKSLQVKYIFVLGPFSEYIAHIYEYKFYGYRFPENLNNRI